MAGAKWSDDTKFTEGGECQIGDKIMGLRSDANYKFDFPSDGIKDGNGNYLIKWATTGAAADNFIQFTNGEAGTPVKIEALGADTNISLDLDLKGTGVLDINGLYTVNGTVSINGIIDDDSMATATDQNIPTSESVVAYIAATPGGAGGSNTQLQYNNAGTLDGISTFTYNGTNVTSTRGVTVDGSSDEIQLKLQGHSTQTSNIFEIETSAASNLLTIDNSGVGTVTGQWNVDNLRLDGNTLSSQDTNGNINLSPDGTGIINLGSATDGFNIAESLDVQIARNNKRSVLGITKYTGLNEGAIIYLAASRATTVGTYTAVNSSDILGNLYCAGADGTQMTVATLIRGNVDGTVSSGVVPGKLEFWTANASGTITEAMSINKSQIVTLVNALPVTSGGTGLQTTTANELLFSSSNDTIAGLATANNATLITSGAGVPSISQTLPTAVQDNITQLGIQTETLDMGTNLVSNVVDPVGAQDAATKAYVDGTISAAGAAGTIARSDGAIYQPSTATFADTYGASELLFSNGANTVEGLATANNGILVTSAAGVPSIGNTIGANISVTGSVTNQGNIIDAGFSQEFPINTSVGAVYQTSKSISGSGVVTIVQLTIPAAQIFVGIKCFVTVSRAVSTNIGTSLIREVYFSIGRNGSGNDVVLDGNIGTTFSATTTSAGGAQNVTSGAMTIVRNGAEANTEPQVVNITVNPSTTGGSGGRANGLFTIILQGATSGFVIT